MKLSRRGMLGAAAGAAVAKTAQFPENKTTVDLSPKDWQYGAKTPMDDSQWRAEQLAKARRLAAGEFTDADRCYPTDGYGCPYAPLKSVSDSARHFLRNRWHDRKWEQRTIQNALKALEEYDRTGFIRSLI